MTDLINLWLIAGVFVSGMCVQVCSRILKDNNAFWQIAGTIMVVCYAIIAWPLIIYMFCKEPK